jgi:hypothetical protein
VHYTLLGLPGISIIFCAKPLSIIMSHVEVISGTFIHRNMPPKGTLYSQRPEKELYI